MNDFCLKRLRTNLFECASDLFPHEMTSSGRNVSLLSDQKTSEVRAILARNTGLPEHQSSKG